jgi:predicted TIM-barrel fold metal-dependent hydrolase
MKTIDTHTHLLNPYVKFDRIYDRLTLLFFAKSLGVDARKLQADPYNEYVKAMANSISNSEHIEKTCIFGVDARLDEKGREIDRDGTVCAMSEDVLTVAKSYPDQFIPFLSVNPRRPDSLDRIDEYTEKGCKGAKFLQNYWGIDLNDERYIPYYEKLKEKNIPLVIHIGSEYSIKSFAEFETVKMLDLPLATGVKVIAAHMALGRVKYKFRFWRNLSKNPAYFDEDYFKLLNMLEEHDNLYADIAAILSPMRARALRHLSEQTQIHHKILFGTDFPVPFTVCMNTHDLSKNVCKNIKNIANPFDRYAKLILEYFPKKHSLYTNYQKILTLD